MLSETEDRAEVAQAPGAGRGRCCGRRHAGGVGRGALVEPAALAALLRAGGHGYDLRKAIADLTDGAVFADAGGLYRVLRRLEDDGFVASRWVDGDSGPQRRDYELTARGRELAEDWLEHLRERERLSRLLGDSLAEGLEGASEPTIQDR